MTRKRDVVAEAKAKNRRFAENMKNMLAGKPTRASKSMTLGEQERRAKARELKLKEEVLFGSKD